MCDSQSRREWLAQGLAQMVSLGFPVALVPVLHPEDHHHHQLERHLVLHLHHRGLVHHHHQVKPGLVSLPLQMLYWDLPSWCCIGGRTSCGDHVGVDILYLRRGSVFKYERREEVPEEGLPVKRMGSYDKSVSNL